MSKKSKSRGGDLTDIKREDVLQAVLLADSFNRRFRPITFERPKTLLPLVNVAMIDYTLEFLAASGVQEIFIFCCAFPKLVEEHVRASKWMSSKLPGAPAVQIVVAEGCESIGDALREIDGKSLIRGDFVLVFGDVITNLNVAKVVAEHKARREKDKSNIMTMILKKLPATSGARSAGEDDVCVTLVPATNRVLRYELLSDVDEEEEGKGPPRHVKVGADVLREFTDVALRTDLVDSHIYVCSPEVLVNFQDNFDYQDIHRDFLRAVLQADAEVRGEQVHAHVLHSEYALRVKDLRSYAAISSHIVRRWVYPITPEFSVDGADTYTYTRPGVYKAPDVKLARTCRVGEDTVLGRGAAVGERTVVRRSVVGRNVHIGADVLMEDAFVWDDAVIEDGVRLSHCIVCSGARLCAGSVLSPGSVVSFKVVVGPGHRVQPYAMLTSTPRRAEEEEEEDFGEEEEDGFGKSPPAAGAAPELQAGPDAGPAAAADAAGPGGHAFLFEALEADSPSPANALAGEEEVERFEAVLAGEAGPSRRRRPGSAASAEESTSESGGSDDEGADEAGDDNDEEEEDPIARFGSEVRATVVRGIVERHRVDNTILEVNGLKFSFNAEAVDCATNIVAGMLEAMERLPGVSPDKPKLLLKAVETMLEGFAELPNKYIRTVGDRVECVKALVAFCAGSALFSALSDKAYSMLVKLFYDAEVFTEKALDKWVAITTKMAEAGDAQSAAYLKKTEDFLDWLKNAEEDEEG
eukprot:tig00021122_g18445.t1